MHMLDIRDCPNSLDRAPLHSGNHLCAPPARAASAELVVLITTHPQDGHHLHLLPPISLVRGSSLLLLSTDQISGTEKLFIIVHNYLQKLS